MYLLGYDAYYMMKVCGENFNLMLSLDSRFHGNSSTDQFDCYDPSSMIGQLRADPSKAILEIMNALEMLNTGDLRKLLLDISPDPHEVITTWKTLLLVMEQQKVLTTQGVCYAVRFNPIPEAFRVLLPGSHELLFSEHQDAFPFGVPEVGLYVALDSEDPMATDRYTFPLDGSHYQVRFRQLGKRKLWNLWNLQKGLAWSLRQANPTVPLSHGY